MRRRTFLTRSAAGLALGMTGLGCNRSHSSNASGVGENAGVMPAAEPRVQATGPDAPSVAERSQRAVTDETPETLNAGPDTMDEVLESLRDVGPQRGNHAPMGAEALIALGHGAVALDWVAGYKRRERLHPRPIGVAVPASQQSRALGDTARLGDWTATFRDAIAERPWRDVLRDWLPRLLPGLAAAATHGLIRTGHAVRSLARVDNPQRREELVAGLGYWAAHYQPVAHDWSPSAVGGTRAPESALPSSALAGIPIAAAGARVRGMGQSLRARSADAGFLEAVSAIAPAVGEEDAFLNDLTATFARVYVAHGATATIPFIHAVTGPSAVRLIMPYLAPRDRAPAVAYAWHTAAGMWASFAKTHASVPELDDQRPAPTPAHWRDVATQAVESGDVHAIKLVEACRREWRAAPDSRVFLAAARDVVRRL